MKGFLNMTTKTTPPGGAISIVEGVGILARWNESQEA